jgi:molybdopterin molybdotransferase
MLSVAEARDFVLKSIREVDVRALPILGALGLTLGQDIVASDNIPPFDNSAMDGYAVKEEDIRTASRDKPASLKVVGDLPAGKAPGGALGGGEAVRIMTGAPIPEGADTVVPVEMTEPDGERVLVMEYLSTGANVRRAGEDVKAGRTVLRTGTLIGPPELGMLASLGHAEVSCYRRAVAGIISTGDELLPVDSELAPGKIRDSNSYTVYAMVKEAGAEPLRLGIVGDQAEALEKAILDNVDRVDLFVTSGGVSVGDYDMVKDVLDKVGEMNFWKVAMRPGKPQAFGHVKGKPLFGLPGNPVSVMVSFEQFVRPALLKMMGRRDLFRPRVDAVLDTPLGRKKGRAEFIRVIVEWRDGCYHARVTGPQGSGILTSMVAGNALAVLPADAGRVEAGELVQVELLRTS